MALSDISAELQVLKLWLTDPLFVLVPAAVREVSLFYQHEFDTCPQIGFAAGTQHLQILYDMLRAA